MVVDVDASDVGDDEGGRRRSRGKVGWLNLRKR